MAERIARLGFMHYRDADGQYRDAVAGETIKVHPDDVERFDSLNVLLGQEGKPAGKDDQLSDKLADDEPEKKPAPRRGRPRKAAQE
jgi:hypothetical protein